MKFTIKYKRKIPSLNIDEICEFDCAGKNIYSVTEQAVNWAAVKTNIGTSGKYEIVGVEKKIG